MKVRFGFVSNSSSSSFILAVKGDKLPSRKKLMETLGIDLKGPGVELFGPLIDHILKDAQPYDFDDYLYDTPTFKVTMENILAGDEGDEPQLAAQLKAKGWKVFKFSGSNEDDGAGQYFHYRSIDIKTDDLIIRGDGE